MERVCNTCAKFIREIILLIIELLRSHCEEFNLHELAHKLINLDISKT